MPDEHMQHFDKLATSLFADTSAFTSASAEPPVPIPVGKLTISYAKRMSDLIEDAIWAIEDDKPREALSMLEEIQELLRDQ